MKLTPKQRKTMRDHLTRRAKTLINNGANLNDVRKLLGATSFKGLTDKRLSNYYNKSKSQRNIVVIDGYIYTREYLKKIKAWYGKDYYKAKMTKGYNKILKSKLNNFKDTKSINRHKRNLQKTVKNRYIERLEFLRETQSYDNKRLKEVTATINKMKKMSMSDFNSFISDKTLESKVSFDAIFVVDSNNDKDRFEEYDTKIVDTIFNDISQAQKNFYLSKKRT